MALLKFNSTSNHAILRNLNNEITCTLYLIRVILAHISKSAATLFQRRFVMGIEKLCGVRILNKVFLYVVMLTNLLINLTLVPAVTAATWYIRTDGGDTTQCTGMADNAYIGSGIAQSCAFNHPFWLLKPNGSGGLSGSAVLMGGDTVVIGTGEYMMGVGAPNSLSCNAAWGYDCTLPPIPSGPDAAHPTKIYGKGWDTKATSPPQIWGYGRLQKILNLVQSKNVELRYLEITDHSDCIYNNPDPLKKCNRTAPYDKPFAEVGIYATDSSNVLLKDLNIHGISKTGIWGGRLTDWTLDGVILRANGFTGWDGDVGHGLIGSGSDSSNHGTTTIRNSKIEYTGCGEKYPSTDLWGCYGQSQGGQGDGFGTYYSEGNWLIEDSEFSHNLQDGFDLLYHTGVNGTVTFNRVRAEGNAGNALKAAGDTKIENSVIIGNCDYFVNNPISETYSGTVEACRATGTPLMIAGWRPGSQSTLVNSLVTGTSTVLIEVKSGVGMGKTLETTGSAASITGDNQYATNAVQDKIWIRSPGGETPLGWNPNGMTLAAVPIAGGTHFPISGTWTSVGNGVWELNGYLSQTGGASVFAYVYLGFTCDGSEKFIARNNIIYGMESWYKKTHGEPGVKADHFYLDGYDGNGNGACGTGINKVVMDNKDSIIYNTKNSACPNSNNVLCVDSLLSSIPPLINTNDMYTYGDRWNVIPKVGSPAIDNSSSAVGTVVLGSVLIPAIDNLVGSRPYGSGIDWGAYEYQLDNTPPVVTINQINITTNYTSQSLSGAATDNVGIDSVTVQLGSQLPNQASYNVNTWTYTVTGLSDGINTIKVVANDVYGNNATTETTIVVNDNVAPTIDLFTIPAYSTSLSSLITTFTASDNIAVTGLLLTKNATKPLSSATGWNSPGPTAYPFPADGTYTLYPWAKDATGNVSTLFTTPRTIVVDTTAPSVSTFTPASISNSLSIPITNTNFIASDTGGSGLSDYCITTTSSSAGCSWNTAPSSFAVSSDGSYTLYPWVKDKAGNISASYSTPKTVIVDTTQPTLTLTPPAPTILSSQNLTGAVSDNNPGTTVTVKVGDAAAAPATLSGSNWSYPAANFGVGAKTIAITVTAQDAAGNVTVATGNIIKLLAGDIDGNGTVDVGDALLAMKSGVGKVTFTSDAKVRGDVGPVNGGVPVPNGSVDTGDAVVILGIAVGLYSF